MHKKLLILFFTWLSLTALAANTTQPLDKIVAVVNSEIITASQVQLQMNVIKRQMQDAKVAMPDGAKLRSQILDQLINQKLLMLLAKRNNITVTDAQLNKAIAGIAAQNHLTLAQLQTAVRKEGISYNQFRKQIYAQMIVQEVQQRALGPSITVTNQDIQNFMRQHPDAGGNVQYHVQDILITTTKQQAEQWLQQLQKNPTLSLVNQTGVQSNDLGWRSVNDLPALFAQKVTTLKTGEITGPIQAPNGFHLIKLVEVKSSGQSLTTAQIRQIIFQQKLQAKAIPWLQQLRKTAYIKIM